MRIHIIGLQTINPIIKETKIIPKCILTMYEKHNHSSYLVSYIHSTLALSMPSYSYEIISSPRFTRSYTEHKCGVQCTSESIPIFKITLYEYFALAHAQRVPI